MILDGLPSKVTNGDCVLPQEEIAKDLLSGDYEEETQSSADDLTPSVTSHEATDFFPRTLRCKAIQTLLGHLRDK